MNEKLEQIERTFANLHLSKLKYKDNNFEIEIERDDSVKGDFNSNNNSVNAIDLEEELRKLKEAEETKKSGLKSVVESLKAEESKCSDLVIAEVPAEKKEEKLSLREELEKELETVEVKCPIVGIFYSKASPEKAPFVEVGTRVSKDDTLCIIEAMKMFTEIKSPVDGIVKSVRFNDEDLVGAEEVIFEIGE